MKRFLIAAAVSAAALAVPLMGVAHAAPPSGGGYGSQPGHAVVLEVGAQCGSGAGSGAFGAFGTFGDVTHDYGINNLGSNGVPGADGTQTGLNNSAVCGNRP
jgi:hypothetical protein